MLLSEGSIRKYPGDAYRNLKSTFNSTGADLENASLKILSQL